MTPEKNKAKLELEWIRGENEKILLDLEKTQSKLDDKIFQCNELKQQLFEKDEQMKEFINKYEKKETNNDDLLNLQSKILDLEHELNQEKEKHAQENEENEERQKDLLKRNDHLWSQMTKLEQNYKDATQIIKNLNQDIELLEEKIRNLDEQVENLSREKSEETLLKEKQIQTCKNLDMELANKKNELHDLNSKYDALSIAKTNENEENADHIERLNSEIVELKDTIKDLEKLNFNAKLDIESLNKEKNFIMNQNESTQQKVLQDFLSLQEKHTSVSYQFEKLTNDFGQLNSLIKEKERSNVNLEAKISALKQEKENEFNEKKDLILKIKLLDSTINKVNILF